MKHRTATLGVLLILQIVISYVNSTCPRIITRSEWGARSPKHTTRLRTNPPPYVVIHHSDTPTCLSEADCKTRIKNVQSQHMNKGWSDIGYNFLIGGDGNVYEGRGWGIHGSHVPKFNSRSIGVSVIGNFETQTPSDLQLNALKDLMSCGVELGKIKQNYQLIGHRQGKPTECPGEALFNLIKTWPHFDSNPN